LDSPRRFREQWASSRANQDQEDAFAGDPSRAAVTDSDFNGSRSDEPAFAHDQFHAARRRALGMHLTQPSIIKRLRCWTPAMLIASDVSK